MKQLCLVIIGMVLGLIVGLGVTKSVSSAPQRELPKFWQVQAIDTVKYSRDLAREKLHDLAFDTVIDSQVKQIADTGATHIAIATPYDEEFLPYLKRWVTAARRHNIHVWYRGNWSGWEGWFDYSAITPKQHLAQTTQFIKNNPELFVDGDIFSSCPECENGELGDPRQTGKVAEFREFLIDITKACETASHEINKILICNYHSSNGDVAKLIMDKPTTQALGGVVVVDHYVKSPQQLADDLKELAKSSGGQIVLGEFGAPLLDIHGAMTETEQAQWITDTLTALVATPEVIGVNYWTNVGGSSSLWGSHGEVRQAVAALTAIYSPNEIVLTIKNRLGDPIASSAMYLGRKFDSDKTGAIHLPKRLDDANVPVVVVSADGYKDQGVAVGNLQTETALILEKDNEDLFFKLRGLLYELSHSIIKK